MKLKFYHFRLVSDDFRLEVPKIAKIKGYLGLLLMFIKTDKLSIQIKIKP